MMACSFGEKAVYLLLYSSILKGQFTPKSQVHTSPLSCSADWSSRLFWGHFSGRMIYLLCCVYVGTVISLDQTTSTNSITVQIEHLHLLMDEELAN